MSLGKEVEIILEEILEFFGLFRPKKHHHTKNIGIVFHNNKENLNIMSAPTSTGTTNNGSPLFGTVQPLQANGTSSNGVVSSLAVTLSTAAFGTATVKTSVAGTQYFEFDPTAVGSVTATVTCTVTDPDGNVGQFTAVATINIQAGAGDVLTASVEVLFSSTQPA